MTFNFPNSPSLGQSYTPASGLTFVWDGIAWKGVSQGAPAIASIGDTPPSSPSPGQLWFESDTGSLFVRYVDVDSSQWVETTSSPRSPTESVIYDTAVGMATTAVPDYVAAFRTNGYSVVGDGGAALYKRAISEPAHAGKVQTLGGAWWELSEERITPFMFGAKGDDTTDDIIALQACFDYATNTKKVEVHCVGTFKIGAKLTIGGGAISKSRTFYFDAFITTTYTSSAEAIYMQNLSGTVCTGEIKLFCGTSDYASRRQWDGVIVEQCSRATLPGFYVEGVKRNGITILPNSNGSSSQKFRATYCGGELAGTFTGVPVNTGSAGSQGQFTTLTVTAMPEVLSTLDYIVYGGRPYAIIAINTGAGTINVFPWVIAPVAGPITYVVGAGILFESSDSNISQIALVTTEFCGVGYKISCLYPPVVQQLQTAHDGIGCTLGGAPSEALIGGFIGSFYVESPSTSINFVEASDTTSMSFVIGSYGPAALTQTFKLYSNNGTSHSFRNLKTNIINWNGRPYNATGYLGGNTTGSAVAPPFADCMSSFTTKYGDTQSVNLVWDAEVNRLFGLDTVYVQAVGTGVRRNPTGTWTFVPPSGWTVLGQSVFSGMTVPTLFSVHYLISTLQVAIIPVTHELDTVSADMGTTTPVTVFPLSSERTLVWNTPFPASIGCTISTTGARNGSRFRFVRTALATGAFTLNLNPGPYKQLSAGQWADMQHNGTIWQLTAFGSL